MIQITNKYIPVKPNEAMTVWPFVFVRDDVRYTLTMKNHEGIHGAQQCECLTVGTVAAIILWAIGCGWWSLVTLPLYYEIYVLIYLYRLLFVSSTEDAAYRGNPFEKEAYENEMKLTYLDSRKPFAWLAYT